MAASPNSALLVGAGCTAAAQRARIDAAVRILEEAKASALAAERYEECATLRDALVPLRARGADDEMAPPGEAALLAALCGEDAPMPQAGFSSLHPQLRCTAWRAENRYFSADVDLFTLPLQEPSAWQQPCSAVLSERGPVGATKRRCQALIAVVDPGTNPGSLSALAAAAEEADPELLLLCEISQTPASADTTVATDARMERLGRLEGNDEGPLWQWSVEHGFEHVILPWHVAVGVSAEVLHLSGPTEAAQPQEEGRQGLARVAEALQNTMWGTLVMKPQPELDQHSATTTIRESPVQEKESCAPAGNSALVVNFVPASQCLGDEDEDEDVEASSTISTASIAAALGLGSEYGSVPAVATWRVHNRYFTADVAIRFVDAASQPAAALEAARATLGEQSPLQVSRTTDSARTTTASVSRCGAVILILSKEMGKKPATSAQLAEWSDLIAKFPYPDGCTGPEMLALCVNRDAAPYAPAIEWCVDHGYELVRPPVNVQQDQGCDDSSCEGQAFRAEDGYGRSIEKEGVWRLVEALKQNVWGTVRMHEQAAPAPRPHSDMGPSDTPAASAITGSDSAGGSEAAAQLQELVLSGTAGEGMSNTSGGSNKPMASMEEMFREVSSFKAASSTMSREQRHAAAERIALNWGLLGGLDGDDTIDSAEEDAELERFLGDNEENPG